jgi:DMSO/TMAO reductase YedYZ heme-binding membrane subunit
MLQGWRLFWIITAVLTAMCAAMVAAMPGEEGVRMAIRATARTSLLLFALAFCASALRRLWPGAFTTWLLRNRRYIGVSFAASHALHLAAIIAFARIDPAEFGTISPVANRIVAGLAYVFIFAMAATSFDRMVALLGARRWKLLHTVGAHYVWLIFLLSFAKRVPQGPEYSAGVALLLAVMGLRLWARKAGSRAAVTA